MMDDINKLTNNYDLTRSKEKTRQYCQYFTKYTVPPPLRQLMKAIDYLYAMLWEAVVTNNIKGDKLLAHAN